MNIDKFLNQHENKDLLRFITCGSVDDGKSTLVGRLLYDSKLIFDDQLNALKKDTEKVGTTKGTGEIDYALLLDGLKAEREQGITIDVAYRYFATPKRKFIIADTPGHEQYTRNMATGASTANLAVILIDARLGVSTQTRRHAFIVSLLGIKHVIVAINKMDLRDYSQEVFRDIKSEFDAFIAKLDISDVRYIPLSALKGDNVVTLSEQTPWYDGDPLLETLEEIDVVGDRNFNDFRFPIQYVIRPDLNFRGFAGSVASGIVRVGDKIKVLPSLKESTVKRIVIADGDLNEAFPPQAITLVLNDEIDVSAGDMIVHANNPPKIESRLDAMVVWMDEKPLRRGSDYIIRQAGRNVKARVDNLVYGIEVNTLHKGDADALALNEIGRVALNATKPLYFDPYSNNRGSGAFILIDPISNTTAAAGMILAGIAPGTHERHDSREERLRDHIGKREFSWDTGHVSGRERLLRNRHYGKTVLVTGEDCIAAAAVAKKLEQKLFQLNMNSYYLGVSNIAEGLDADIKRGFHDRDEHVRRLGELGRIMSDAGLIFITALSDADDYDLDCIRQLNYPNDLLVIRLGPGNGEADIELEAEADIDAHISTVFRQLSERQIIPDYCI